MCLLVLKRILRTPGSCSAKTKRPSHALLLNAIYERLAYGCGHDTLPGALWMDADDPYLVHWVKCQQPVLQEPPAGLCLNCFRYVWRCVWF